MPLDDLSHILGTVKQRTTLFGAPEGHDAAVLGALLRDGNAGSWLHVCRDDARMGRFAAALAFFHPGLAVLTFPAWDCLPYDRVSPDGEITSRRIDTLTRLAAGDAKGPLFVLTTVNAVVQRVPPRGLFDGRVLAVGPGGRIGLDRLQSFFRNNGYTRTDTVREPGEFAIRGGIVDLYPSGAAQPVRLDFFGDQVESLRSFDPLTQRSTGSVDKLELKPVSEVLLDEPAIHRFRTRYRELFGNVGSDDALYESVSAGRRYAGMEHWLPLYYERLETLFDYMPGAGLSFDYQADEVRHHRLEGVADFYAARQSIAASGASSAAPRYRPVKPDQLFVGDDEWRALLSERTVVQLSPFESPHPNPPPLAGEGAANAGSSLNPPPRAGEGRVGAFVDAGARPARSFAAERADPKVNLFEAVRDYLDAERKAGKRAAIAAYSAGAADRLATVLRERGLSDLRSVADGDALEKLPRSSVGLAILPLEQGFATDSLVVLGEQDILGDRLARTPRRRRNLDEFIAEASALAAGDLVVHEEHGIGRYEGLETIDVGGAPHDCLKVLYAGDDRLFVPVENIEVLS